MIDNKQSRSSAKRQNYRRRFKEILYLLITSALWEGGEIA
jgi:hypothetical protein